MKLKCDASRPGDLLLNGKLFASIHPGQGGLGDDAAARLRLLAQEMADRWNEPKAAFHGAEADAA